MRRYLILIGLMVAVFAAGGVLASDAAALEPGDDVTFLVPAGEVPSGGFPAGTTFIFLGGPTGTIDATGCQTGATSAPVQAVNFITPGEGATGPIDVVIVFQTGGGSDPIEPGTRVGDIGNGADCNVANGTAYKRFNAKVQ